MSGIKEIDAVILCGGKGKRLRGMVNDRPKPLADIDGRAFLDILLGRLAEYGFKRFIFCTGYKGSMIKDHFKERGGSFNLLYSQEERKLGTAGALKNSERLISSEFFLSLNGDSFCSVNFAEFMNFHLSKESDISIALVESSGASDIGAVEIDDSGRVISFSEKRLHSASKLVNAGIYFMKKEVLSLIPGDREYSLEYDLFPKMAGKRFFGYRVDTALIDIGTPAGYKRAKTFFENTGTLL